MIKFLLVAVPFAFVVTCAKIDADASAKDRLERSYLESVYAASLDEVVSPLGWNFQVKKAKIFDGQCFDILIPKVGRYQYPDRGPKPVAYRVPSSDC